VPEDIDRFALRLKLKADSQNPLNIVLGQEVDRYGVILNILRNDLQQLELGLKGLVVITPDLEAIVNAIQQNVTPVAWNKTYFSSKPLSNWFDDLKNRY
jgi:dynein heavy chain